MIGIAVGEHRDTILKRLQTRGALAIPAGNDVVRFLPPFTVTADELNGAANALTDVLAGLGSQAMRGCDVREA